MNHRPVCVSCNTEMRCHKNGVGVLDMAHGCVYQIWEADNYRCPCCGIEVVMGFAQRGLERWEAPFESSLNRHTAAGTLIRNYSEGEIREKAEIELQRGAQVKGAVK